VLSPGPWPMVLAASNSLSLAPPPSVSASVSASVHGPRAPFLACRRAMVVGSSASARRDLMRDATTDCADSLRERPASRVRRMALLRSASAWDQTVRQTPW
jgi:hypothetical protein